jgi:membrane protein implicated in regulation of membrane protease activity
MNTPKIILIAVVGMAIFLVVGLPIIGFAFQFVLPALFLAAVAVAGWWGIRRLQGVDNDQARQEIGDVGSELSRKTKAVAAKVVPATKAAVKTFQNELQK